VITVYALFKFFNIDFNIYDYITTITILACELAYCVLIFPIYNDYSWKFFKKVGSDVHFRAMYRRYQMFKAFMKFDLLFGFIILVSCGIFSPFFTKDWETTNLVLDISILIVAFIVFIFGFFGVKRERVSMMFAFFVFSICQPVYIIYKFKQFLEASSGYQVYLQFFLPAIAAIIVRVSCVIVGALCIRNFGKGIKGKEFLKQAKIVDRDSLDEETKKLLYS